MKLFMDLIDSLQKINFPANWNPLTMLTTTTKTPTEKTKTGTKVAKTTPEAKQTRSQGPKDLAKLQRLVPEGGQILQRLYDCCAYVIVCPKHNQIAVARQPNSSITWLPFTVLPSNRSWHDGAMYGSLIVLSDGTSEQFIALQENVPYQETNLIDVFRFQLPQTQEFVVRLTFYIQLDPNTSNKKFTCCTNIGRIQWIPLEMLNSGIVDHVWGPELLEFCRWASTPNLQRIHVYR